MSWAFWYGRLAEIRATERYIGDHRTFVCDPCMYSIIDSKQPWFRVVQKISFHDHHPFKPFIVVQLSSFLQLARPVILSNYHKTAPKFRFRLANSCRHLINDSGESSGQRSSRNINSVYPR